MYAFSHKDSAHGIAGSDRDDLFFHEYTRIHEIIFCRNKYDPQIYIDMIKPRKCYTKYLIKSLSKYLHIKKLKGNIFFLNI